MRTTLTLDPEVAQQIKALMRDSRRSMRKVVNDLLRRALAGGNKRSAPRRVKIQSYRMGWRDGLDPGRLNQLYDELEAESSLKNLVLHERPDK
jgi:hypothetical protein